MPKIEIDKLTPRIGSVYPTPYNEICGNREKIALGNAAGLDQFGVNLTRLKPGTASAHKHWHLNEDEFIYILEGEAILVEDTGETILTAGDAAGFKAGNPNGHMLVNRSENDVVLLEVGTRSGEESVTYTDPDVDMHVTVNKENGFAFTKKDGSSFD